MVTFVGDTLPSTFAGTNQDDSVLGAPGADTNPAAGGPDDRDTLSGDGGNDIIYGGGGDDLINGGTSTDSLYGGDGNDTLDAGVPTGNAGTELLEGGNGNDYFIPNAKTDIVAGGDGIDTVNLSAFPGATWTQDPTTGDWSTSTPNGPINVSGVEWFTDGTSFNQNPNLVCFAAGTRIATARGEVTVEDLRVGDLVLAAHGGAPLQPVMWLGRTRVNVARQADRTKVAPILIKAGALADGVPHRDLRVSPEHAMFLDGRLVPAKHLVNGTSIVQELWCAEVTYWHVELPSHGLLVADGAVSESYFDDGNRKHFDNYGIATLFKDFASERGNGRYAEAACYPLLTEGDGLEAIRARIAARAAAEPLRRSA